MRKPDAFESTSEYVLGRMVVSKRLGEYVCEPGEYNCGGFGERRAETPLDILSRAQRPLLLDVPPSM